MHNFRRLVKALAIGICLIPAATMKASIGQDRSAERLSIVEDWTSRHLVFSGAQSGDQARRMTGDSRYRQQWLRRNKPAFTGQDSLQALAKGVRESYSESTVVMGDDDKERAGKAASKAAKPAKPPKPPKNQPAFGPDWAVSLGAGASVGAEMYPAKYNFDIAATPSCVNDFVVYNTSLAGAGGAASVVAFNQLYSTQGFPGGFCNQNGPSVMWSYRTGLGSVVTSPILSLDGSKIIYVQTAGTGAVLHILRWKAGEGTVAAPVVPTQTVSTLASCTGTNSCDVQIPVNGNPTITNSAPFYDYTNDALYVGDDAGKLHKFQPVLNGTLTEVLTGGWPFTVNANVVLSSPVADSFGSGNVFVGDANGRLSYVRESFSTVGTCLSGSAPCVGGTFQPLGGAIVDPPTIDVSTGKVFVFNGTDANRGSVYQFNTALGGQVTANVGNATAASPRNIHGGAFDQGYLTSPSGNGYLYVCGKVPSGVVDIPAIHRIAITGGTMSSTSDGGLALGTEAAECSPVTGVFNAPTNMEFIFFSVGDGSNQTAAGCTAGEGCLTSINLTALNGTWNPPTTPSAVTRGYRVPTLAGGIGTSGIIIDNTVFPTMTSLNPSGSTTLSGSASTTLGAGGLTTTLTAQVAGAVAQRWTLNFQMQEADNTSFVTIQGIVYEFRTATLPAPPSARCYIRTPGAANLEATTISRLAAAITNSGVGTNESWLCNADASQPSNGVTVFSSTSPNLVVQAKIPGATGVTITESSGGGGNNRLTATPTTAGSDGPTSIPVASGAGIVNGDLITIDSETMLVTGGGGTNTLTVTRGAQSTTVALHNNGATVTDISRISSGQTTINVASTTGFNNGDVLLMDSEQIVVSNVVNVTQLSVSRGANSTTAATHLTGATVLNRTVSAAATTLTLASTSGIASGDHLLIDSEKVLVGSVSGSQVTVTRAQLSTSSASHTVGVAVANLTTSAGASSILVGGVLNFQVNDYILVDSEIMQVTGIVFGNTSFTVSRGLFGTTAAAHRSPTPVLNISANSASIYFSFFGNSTAGAPCNGASGVGCAVKLTQVGLR